MIRVLSISGSPVKDASTDWILKKLSETVISKLGAETESEAHFIKLNDLNFAPCQSCGEAPTEGFCLLDDGLAAHYDLVANCDLLLFGSPVYFDSVSAQAKMFIDRCSCFRPPDFDNASGYQFVKKVSRHRPGAMVLVGGERGWMEGARRVIAGLFKWIDVGNEGMITYQSPNFHETGSAANSTEVIAQIERMATHLADIIRGKA